MKVEELGFRYNRASSQPENGGQLDDESLPSTHFLIPATDVNVNLCKTLLTAGILGYPSPSILAWKEPFDESGGLAGGTHLLKISKTLQYLNSLQPEQDDELVFMIDAYDIHFQLPFEVLIGRYRSLIRSANVRLQEEMGTAFHKQSDMRQSIVFGAGKRCAPNAPWEVACYTVPDSPAPDDLYGNNTDTMMGNNQWWSSKQKFINSGYIIGPVGAMRKLFERAYERAEEHKQKPMYGGSDQAIFSFIMGGQSYVREQLRLEHLSTWERYRNPAAAKPRNITIQGGLPIDNILHPSISHTPFTPDPDLNYEFGITLDYLSELGHQTMNSDIGLDSQWLSWNGTRELKAQVKAKYARHGKLDCPLRLPSAPPEDLMRAQGPFSLIPQLSKTAGYESWLDVPLYTHLCMGTVPVMIHHNGWKKHREEKWEELWLQPRARELLHAAIQEEGPASHVGDWDTFKARPGLKVAGGAWTDKGKWINWPDMCPDAEYASELFRDIA